MSFHDFTKNCLFCYISHQFIWFFFNVPFFIWNYLSFFRILQWKELGNKLVKIIFLLMKCRGYKSSKNYLQSINYLLFAALFISLFSLKHAFILVVRFRTVIFVVIVIFKDSFTPYYFSILNKWWNISDSMVIRLLHWQTIIKTCL